MEQKLLRQLASFSKSLTRVFVPDWSYTGLDISTDFERGFISAEVMKYNDLRQLGSEAQVRASGKYMSKGKDYVVEDGDIMYFKVSRYCQLPGSFLYIDDLSFFACLVQWYISITVV